MSKPDGYNAVAATVIYSNGSINGANCSYCNGYHISLSDNDTIIIVRTRNLSSNTAVVKIGVRVIFFRDYTL